MAIDFSKVKTITIPEGSVKKITDSTGAILWEKGPSWHTIWEGSKTCITEKSGYSTPVVSGAEENLAQTAVGTGYKPKIRITFSYSNTNTSSRWDSKFIINNVYYSKPQSSPITINNVNNTYNSIYICASCCKSDDGSSYVTAGLRKERDTENNRIIIHLRGSSTNDTTSYSGNFTITFTVTKIEQYY